MNKSYHAIPATRLTGSVPYLQPPKLPEVTHINDPALSVMVDFNYHQPPLIAANKSLDHAKLEMQVYHSPVLFVTNTEEKIIGTITSEDILGEKPVKISQEKRIPRQEIEIEMLMTPCKELMALDVNDLSHAKLGHIIQTLREIKQHTLLVVEVNATTNKPALRGFFSASLISKQLDKDITLVLSEARSIAELQHGMQH